MHYELPALGYTLFSFLLSSKFNYKIDLFGYIERTSITRTLQCMEHVSLRPPFVSEHLNVSIL